MNKLSTLIIIYLSISKVYAQNVNIPDQNFKNHLLSKQNLNTNGDSEIQISEANAYSSPLDVSNLNIMDLTGIEAFVNLSELDCFANQITQLDLTANINLTELICNSNDLTQINVGANVNLIKLALSNNAIDEIDISNNVLLEELFVSNNSLDSLNLTQNTNLEKVLCDYNQIKKLDFSNLPLINFIKCNSCSLTILNVANGNNGSISNLTASNNANLICITHDAGFNPGAAANWVIDVSSSWSADCDTFLGIKSNETSKVSIYPNPSSGIISIATDISIESVSIKTITGKTIGSFKSNHIDLSYLKSGIYLIQIKGKKMNYMERLFIE